MRYDAEHKARTRERVLVEAARSLRIEGPSRLGVAEVMKQAGLTHGGFYSHFRSKDDLIGEAIRVAFGDAKEMFEQACQGRTPRAALAKYIAAYLSMAHRDGPGHGCPLPALATDLPRMGHEARSLYADGVRRLTARLHGLLEAGEIRDAEALAPSVVAELVGALSIARALPDAAEAGQVLRRSRAALIQRLGLEASA